MTNRRSFLKRAGLAGAGAVGASTLAAPYVKAQAPIKWRLQTYAGAPLGAYVIQPSIEAFNKAANGEMEIELYFADQLVPQGELFRAVQQGTLDAAQSDDDSMGSPADVAVFGAYFPFATLLQPRRAGAVRELRAQGDSGPRPTPTPASTWLGSGAWDPCNLGTTVPVKSLADLQGKRIFTFPTAGRFLTQFGVVPVTLPWEDVEVAMQTGELDGIWWCGATEIHSVGWSNVMKYYLTNNINGAWIGSYFVNSERWAEVPEHLKQLLHPQHGQLELLPPALVLVGRGALPHQRQARADLDPGRGMGDGRRPRRRSSGTRWRPRASARRRWCRSSRTTPRRW